MTTVVSLIRQNTHRASRISERGMIDHRAKTLVEKNQICILNIHTELWPQVSKLPLTCKFDWQKPAEATFVVKHIWGHRFWWKENVYRGHVKEEFSPTPSPHKTCSSSWFRGLSNQIHQLKQARPGSKCCAGEALESQILRSCTSSRTWSLGGAELLFDGWRPGRLHVYITALKSTLRPGGTGKKGKSINWISRVEQNFFRKRGFGHLSTCLDLSLSWWSTRIFVPNGHDSPKPNWYNKSYYFNNVSSRPRAQLTCR